MNYLGLLDGQRLVEGYDRYIWMSERCLEGIAWCKEKGLPYTILPKNWSTDQDIRDCMAYLESVKKVVLEYARDILNEYHHADYAIEQWNILLSQWLNIYLGSYYDKYLKLKQVEAAGIDCECDLYHTDEMISLLDYTDYMRLLSETDAYHVYQYSRLYAAMKPFEHIFVRQSSQYERPERMMRKGSDDWKASAKHIVFRALKLIWKNDDVVLQRSYLPSLFLRSVMLKRPGRVVNYSDFFPDYYERHVQGKLPSAVDMKWRNSETGLPRGTDDFTALMCEMLKKELPIAYVEGFGYLRIHARKFYRHAMRPKAVLFADGATSSDELFKVYLMEVKPSGALLCDIQHGGGMGQKLFMQYDSEYEICDVFYTWGWQKREAVPCAWKPMPAVKLTGKAFQNPENGDILFADNCNAKNVFRAMEFELTQDERLNEERSFLKKLSPAIKSRFRFRPYMRDLGWGYYEKIQRENTDMRFDPILDYHSSLDSAKLVISSDWFTTICEALAANRAILVLNKPVCMEEATVNDIEEMHRVGILAYTFEELGEMLEEAAVDIDTWWNEPERQAVVKRIRDKYAYLPPDAERIWEKELLRLADGATDN